MLLTQSFPLAFNHHLWNKLEYFEIFIFFGLEYTLTSREYYKYENNVKVCTSASEIFFLLLNLFFIQNFEYYILIAKGKYVEFQLKNLGLIIEVRITLLHL